MAKTGWTLGKLAALAANTSHLIVRRDGVLCCHCYETEPVHVGESGTPMTTLIYAYATLAMRHKNCKHEKVDTKGHIKVI